MRSGEAQCGSRSEGTKSAYLEAISHRRRRRVLDILQTQKSPLKLTELAHFIIDGIEKRDQDEVEQIRISLYHRHLPLLDDVGLVEFNEEQDEIAITEKALGELR